MEKLLSAIIGATLLSLLYGSVRFWFHSIERVRRGIPIVPFEPRRPVPWGLLDGVLIFLLVFFAINAAQLAAVGWWKISLDRGVSDFTPQQFAMLMLAGSFATLVGCLASLLLVRVRTGATLSDIGLVAAEFWSDVKLGAMAFVMLAPPMYLMQIGLTQIWEYEHPVQDLLEQQTDLAMLAVTLITAVGVAPFAEEMFFRVLLQGWLENVSVVVRKALGLTFSNHFVESDELQRDWRAVMIGDPTGEAFTEHSTNDQATAVTSTNFPVETWPPIVDDGNPYASPRADTVVPWSTLDSTNQSPTSVSKKMFRPGHVPLVLSAAIFALMHLGQGPAPIPLFFLAMGLGYLYRQTHRATPSIVVHFLINSVSMAVFWLNLIYKS